MKKDLLKLAMIGLVAGISMSADANESGKEIAMSKCSKTTKTDDQKGCNSKGTGCNGKNSGCNAKGSGCNGASGCTSEEDCDGSAESKSSSNDSIQQNRKSAARKVLEGY